jgi:hypothetical protein
MLKFLEFLTYLDWLLLPRILIQTFQHANWNREYKRAGTVGIVKEGVRSLLGTNTYVFFVPIKSRWDERSINRLLARYRIPMWGYGFDQGLLFFYVRAEDAAQAQALMLRAGVELVA